MTMGMHSHSRTGSPTASPTASVSPSPSPTTLCLASDIHTHCLEDWMENQKVMLGTFNPRQEPYTYEVEEDTTPSGIFARGSYSAKLKFVDDDGKVYLDMSYSFEIRKDWPASS